MTSRSGESSPTSPGVAVDTKASRAKADLSANVACVRPTFSSTSTSSSARCAGALANWRAKREEIEKEYHSEDETFNDDELLAPLTPDEIRKRVRPGFLGGAQAKSERIVVTAEEEAVMDEPVNEYLRNRQVAGTPAERLIRKEYIAEAQRRLAEGADNEPEEAEGAMDESDEVQEGDGLRDVDGAAVFEDESGEGRRPRLPPGVPVPSAEMVRRHRASGHCPYRSWCSCCVSGAANAPGHVARVDPPLCGVPELHSDYTFFRDRKGDKNTATVLVIKERSKSGVAAHVVPKKGSGGGFIVKQFERDIRKFGHRHKVLLRSDNEPAMKDLLNKVSALRAPETIIEHSPVGDSKANGRAERAVQAVEKQVRVLKLSTDEHFRVFSVLHPCFPWLVLHSADVITKFKVHPDGLTSYEKIKGREYTGLMLEFATTVLYKVSAEVQGGLMRCGSRGFGWASASVSRSI